MISLLSIEPSQSCPAWSVAAPPYFPVAHCNVNIAKLSWPTLIILLCTWCHDTSKVSLDQQKVCNSQTWLSFGIFYAAPPHRAPVSICIIHKDRPHLKDSSCRLPILLLFIFMYLFIYFYLFICKADFQRERGRKTGREIFHFQNHSPAAIKEPHEAPLHVHFPYFLSSSMLTALERQKAAHVFGLLPPMWAPGKGCWFLA